LAIHPGYRSTGGKIGPGDNLEAVKTQIFGFFLDLNPNPTVAQLIVYALYTLS
jgi:hypothetical protein